MAAFSKAFVNVALAEIFDKTWFVTLFMAIPYSKLASFLGAFSALAVHVFIAAGLGVALTKVPFLHASTLDFLAAAVMLLLALWYAYDACMASKDADVVAEGKEETQQALGDRAAQEVASGASGFWHAVGGAGAIFLAVFVAEWADRTQFVMIALHASQPLWPVVFASLCAFLLLCATAVLTAKLITMLQISKRWLNVGIALSFVVFAALSIVDGCEAIGRERLLIERAPTSPPGTPPPASS